MLAGGSFVAQLLPILMTPVVTRIYSDHDLGILALYVAFITFVANALTLGFSQAIVTGMDDEEGARLTVLSGLMVGPMSFFGSVLLALLVSNGLLGLGELPLWTVGIMFFSLLLTGSFFTLRYWMIRVGDYRTISEATVAQSLGRMATQVVLGVLGAGWPGLVAGEVVGRGTGLRQMWKRSRTRLSEAWYAISWSDLGGLARKYRKFPLLTAPSSLLNSLSIVLPVPLISMLFGVGTAGQYAIAARIMVLPLSLIGNAVGDVFHNRIAFVSRLAPERAKKHFLRTTAILFAVGLVPSLVVASWGPPLFQAVLGPEWNIAGAIAAAIVPWVLAQFVVNPVSRLVQVYQGQEFKLVYDILAVASIVGVISFGDQHGWSLIRTLRVLGLSQAFVYGVYFLILLRILTKNVMINALKDDSLEENPRS